MTDAPDDKPSRVVRATLDGGTWPDHAVEWRHLPPTARHAWGGFLQAHARLWRELDNDLQASHQLSLADFDVLRNLSSAVDHQMRMSHLAEAVVFSRSGLTRLVQRLESRGLVRRHRPPRDVRQVYAQLTPDGSALLAAAEPTHVSGVRDKFLGHLDEELTTALARACDRILPKE